MVVSMVVCWVADSVDWTAVSTVEMMAVHLAVCWATTMVALKVADWAAQMVVLMVASWVDMMVVQWVALTVVHSGVDSVASTDTSLVS